MPFKEIELISRTDFDFDLKDILLITCHHILETNLFLINHLIRKGLKPRNIFVIGKCYSTNEEILKEYQKLGAYVDESSLLFNPDESFDTQFKKNVDIFLSFISKKVDFNDFKRIILWDEGSELILHVNSQFDDVSKVIAIEQTSSGYNKLKNENLRFPVINVARSKTKLELESPIIAERSIQQIDKFLDKNNKYTPQKILILGGGPIGKAMKSFMEKRYAVRIFDKTRRLSEINQTKLNESIENSDMIIGCTGTTSINHSMYYLIQKDTVLVSVSSSDVEFDAVYLRKDIPVSVKIKVHADLPTKHGVLLNNGFPITFSGEREGAPLNKIQITRALIYTAVGLASKEHYKKGLNQISKEIQDRIIKHFCEIMSKK